MRLWPKKSLGEVANFINGYPFKPTDWSANGLPIIRIQNLTNPAAPANRYNGAFDKRYAVQDGDLLVSWSATLDVFIWNGGSAILNQHIFLVAPDLSQVSKTYLFYALKSVMDELRSQTHGATMKHITKGPFERTQIPVPPIAEQERLVKLLDEADELRKLRAQADQRTSALIPALFHEMFGDCITNTKRWPVSTLGKNLNVLYRYPTFYGTAYVDNGVPVARIGNILPTHVLDPDLSNYVRVPPEFSARFPKTILQADDLVMAVRGDTTGKIGRAPSDLAGANISPNLIRISPNDAKLTSEYLLSLFLFAPSLVTSHITDTAKKSITADNIGRIGIPVPPLLLQQEFAHRVVEMRKLEAAQSSSRQRLDALFQSMLHRAFNGEL